MTAKLQKKELKKFLPYFSNELYSFTKMLSEQHILDSLREDFFETIILNQDNAYLKISVLGISNEIKIKIIYQGKAIFISFYQTGSGFYFTEIIINILEQINLNEYPLHPKLSSNHIPSNRDIMFQPLHHGWSLKPYSVFHSEIKRWTGFYSSVDFDIMNTSSEFFTKDFLQQILIKFDDLKLKLQDTKELKKNILKDFDTFENKNINHFSQYEKNLEDF